MKQGTEPVYAPHVMNRSQALLRDALALPAADRASLATELLASLEEASTDDPQEVRDAWVREIERRAHTTLAGDFPGEEWQSVRDRISGRLGRE